MERKFVIALVETGGDNAAQAARFAGCATGREAQAAWEWKRRPRVLAAIREMAEFQLRAGALLGASAMIEIARDPLHKDRLKAADRLMERAGMLVIQRSEHIVEDRRETKEIIAGLKDLAERAGIPLETILGKGAKDVVDGEYEDVDDSSTEGLEDLL
jgi:phage terminase small subunit